MLGPTLWEATKCNSSPSKRNTFANRPPRERPHFVQWSQIRAARRSVTRVFREGSPRSLLVALAPRRARALDRQIALLNGQWIPVRSLLCESCVYSCAGAWFHGAACRPQAVHDNAKFYLSSNGHAMSALGQKQTFAVQKSVSALLPKADMCGATRDVRFVPKSRHARARLKCLTTGNPCVMSLTLRSGGCD